MNEQQLIAKLNWFYSLELNQVEFYNAQSKSFNDRYTGLVFARISAIEQQHVDNIRTKITELGGKPSALGDVLSPMIGRLAGTALSLTGLKGILTTNILIEQKAMKDYNKLIDALRHNTPVNSDLIKLLQHNFIDEHLHTEWFRTKLLGIKQYEFTAKDSLNTEAKQYKFKLSKSSFNINELRNRHQTNLKHPKPISAKRSKQH